MKRALDKKEAVLHGRFVTAAYAMFKRDPTLLRPEPAPGDIPAPYELVAWLNMSDFIFWCREKPKFYGFIARDQQQKHNFVLAIRGTEGWVEWLDDIFVRLVAFRQVPDAGRVEHGFDKIYSTLKVVKRHVGAGVAPAAKPSAPPAVAPEVMQGSFAEQLEQLADTLEEPGVQEQIRTARVKRPRRSFVVTGHSLGAALATLFAMENDYKKKFNITTICTFASPRVGDTDFAERFNHLPPDSWRIVNCQDIVPKIPFRITKRFDYEHVETPYWFSSGGVVKWCPVCWHSMSTYLHWLDPTIAIDGECKK
jgi:Lipase (class 3)